MLRKESAERDRAGKEPTPLEGSDDEDAAEVVSSRITAEVW